MCVLGGFGVSIPKILVLSSRPPMRTTMVSPSTTRTTVARPSVLAARCCAHPTASSAAQMNVIVRNIRVLLELYGRDDRSPPADERSAQG